MRVFHPGLVLLPIAACACAHASPDQKGSVQVDTIPARPEDVGSIDGVMRAFYEVVNLPPDAPRQWARDRTLHVPWIRFIATGRGVEIMDHQRFVDESEPLVRAGFRERELGRIVRVYGNIAHVESAYEARSGPDRHVAARGVNYIQLYFDGKRWWVTSVIWQSEDAAHPIPPELLAPSAP